MSRTTVWRRRGCTHVPRVYLPFEPLRQFIEARYGGANSSTGLQAAARAGINCRQWSAYREKGVVLGSADRIAVRLGVHPAVIWGRDWFTAGDDE